jgi:hypothetical protein
MHNIVWVEKDYGKTMTENEITNITSDIVRETLSFLKGEENP